MRSKRTVDFERIMAVHGATLRRVVGSYARPGPDREDLSQEIGLAIWRALPRFQGRCSERTFVVRIAHNRGLHFAYKRRRSLTEPEAEVPDRGSGPEAQASALERREVLLAAIRCLPVDQRQVLTLALEGFSHQELADIIGIGVGNVAVRLHRARAELRKRLEGLNVR